MSGCRRPEQILNGMWSKVDRYDDKNMLEDNMKTVTVLLTGVILSLFIPLLVSAAVPSTINFQGYLTTPAGVPVSGTMSLTF